MQHETPSPQKRFSPKVIAVILAASLLVLLCGLLLFRSALTGNVLETLEYGDFRFKLCGGDTLAKIVVYQNGEKTATVHTASVGSSADHYGVTVSDLNYDGYPDLLVVQRTQESDQYFAVWTWNNATGTYKSAEALLDVPNLTANDDFQCLVSHAEEYRFVGDDSKGSYYEDAEIYRVFRAVNGELVEYARYEFIYYTKNDIYSYQIFRFDAREGSISHFSEDRWMSPTDAEGFSLSDAMRDDMEIHRSDYFPAKTEEGTEESSTSSEE